MEEGCQFLVNQLCWYRGLTNLLSKDQTCNWYIRTGDRDYFLGLLGRGVGSPKTPTGMESWWILYPKTGTIRNWHPRIGDRDSFLRSSGIGVNSPLASHSGVKRTELQPATQRQKKGFLLGIRGSRFPLSHLFLQKDLWIKRPES